MGYEGGFFKAPNTAFELRLNPYQIAVYMYLCRCSNNDASAYPSYATIAEKCGMSKSKANTTVDELIELKLVEKTTRFSDKSKQSNVYTINKDIPIPQHGTPLYHDMVYPIPQSGNNKELSYKELDYKDNTSNQDLTLYFLEQYTSDYKQEIENILRYYYNSFINHKRDYHPKLKEYQLHRVYKAIELLLHDTVNIQLMIDEFFLTVKNSDHKIQHFLNDGILDILKERCK